MRFEQDEIELLGGIRHGRTLGSPIAIVIRNSEWATGRWREEMSAAPGATASRSRSPGPATPTSRACRSTASPTHATCSSAPARARPRRVSRPARSPSSCCRISACRCSATSCSWAAAVASPGCRPGPGDLEAIDSSEVRCCDPDAEAEMIREIKEAAKAGDSLGGVVEVLGFGLPPGLGSHVHWDRRIDGLLAQALMSIQAMKAVEIGEGITVVGGRERRGRRDRVGRRERDVPPRVVARGGIEGGMTTGDLLAARVSMKPLATLNRPVLKTVDTETKEESVSFKERTDVTAVPAAGVVAETMTACARVRVIAQVRRRLARRVRAEPRFVRRLAAMSPQTDADAPAPRAGRADGDREDDGGAGMRGAACPLVRRPRRADHVARGHAHRGAVERARRGPLP